jgi:hypothetical protein
MKYEREAVKIDELPTRRNNWGKNRRKEGNSLAYALLFSFSIPLHIFFEEKHPKKERTVEGRRRSLPCRTRRAHVLLKAQVFAFRGPYRPAPASGGALDAPHSSTASMPSLSLVGTYWCRDFVMTSKNKVRFCLDLSASPCLSWTFFSKISFFYSNIGAYIKKIT